MTDQIQHTAGVALYWLTSGWGVALTITAVVALAVTRAVSNHRAYRRYRRSRREY